MSEYQFASKARGDFVLTPLGAAIVEALPNQARKRKIQRDFEQRHECPTSEIFPAAADVESFYLRDGAKIRGVQKGRRRHDP